MPTKLQRSRERAFQSQCGKCFYCGAPMWLRTPVELAAQCLSKRQAARLKCTAEHLVPRSEGGSDCSANIVAACAHCNGTRHKRKVPPLPEAYRVEVRKRVARGYWHHQWVYERGLIQRV